MDGGQERRLGDRARRVEKTYNRATGEEETEDNSFGIQDGEEEHFDREFQQAMGAETRHASAYSAGGRNRLLQHQQHQSQSQQQMVGYGGERSRGASHRQQPYGSRR